jgi:hypothetical protein
MKSFVKYIIPAAAVLLTMGLSSCNNDLNIDPIDPNQHFTKDITPEQLINKCYANFAKGGNGAADDNTDFSADDGGTTGFVRQVFNCENLTTDEAICAWGDAGIEGWNNAMPDASNAMLTMLYNRMYVGIAYCNRYLDTFGDHDATMTAEVRFLRAYEYWVLLDIFGNPAFATSVSNESPKQISRVDLYNWILSELKEIEPNLNDPQPKKEGETGYGRVDKAADWLLQARLYINAKVYTGTADWDNAKTYAKKVMDSPYKLYTGETKNGWTAYQQLFMGDNGTNGASVEAVFPLIQDGNTTRSYGCTRFLIQSATNNTEKINPDGTTVGTNTNDQWSGNRARPQLIEKFFSNTSRATGKEVYQMPEAANDDRALFEGNGRTLDVTSQAAFKNGFGVCKWNNWYTTGNQAGHDVGFPDTDYFLMRSAEAYLIFAEADANINGGTTTAQGTAAINALRNRAHAVLHNSYNLNFICDEWSREFYWEGLRRPTLIRFGRFAGNSNYTWAWKGGELAGRNVDAHFNLFPLPSDELNANHNLKQNPGY